MSVERIEAIQTRWSLIRMPVDGVRPESALELRKQLVLRYAAAVRRYVGAIVKDQEDADELAQDVVMRLMKGDFAGADPNKGRFRDLLKTAIRNMIRNHWDKAKRRKTSDADLALISDSSEDEQEMQWTAAWQKSILDHTWAHLRSDDQQAIENGKSGNSTTILRLRVEHPDATSEELAAMATTKLQTEIKPDNFRQMLRRARQRFVELLIDEVRSGLDDESEERLHEELAALNLLHWVKATSQ